MANFVYTDAKVTINSVDLSTAIRKVSLSVEVDGQENTAMGGAGWRSRLGGLRDSTCELEFAQDFAAAQVDATLWAVLGTTTTVAVRPTSGAISATNPEYIGSMLLEEYSPIDGEVGDAATASVTFIGSGALTRDTTP
ncbi:MAG: hypothetical protein ACRDRZ_03630 [Pseudonocardiaceae bacterium]